jgi:hypothetical protein
VRLGCAPRLRRLAVLRPQRLRPAGVRAGTVGLRVARAQTPAGCVSRAR